MITVMKRALPADLSRDIRRGRALRSGGRTDDRSGAGAGGLAPGWKETTAPDGRTYYFNDKGETSWEKPVDPAAATSSRAESKPKKGAIVAAVKPVIPGVADIGKLPQGWRMLTGDDGRSYYYNKKTGVRIVFHVDDAIVIGDPTKVDKCIEWMKTTLCCIYSLKM